MRKSLKIGTRGSPLALTQTEMMRAALAEKFPNLQSEVVVIKTSGDWVPADGEVRLSEAQGGKGLFAKEIEAALLAGTIDCAVHSMKDMDSHLPDGLTIDYMLPRQDARDCLIFKNRDAFSQKECGDLAGLLAGLPAGTRVGTSSVRRAAFLKNARADIEIVPLRGNVQTRIEKLEAGQVDVTLLAMAGLNRLGLGARADVIISEDAMLPSAGQGAVGIEIRKADTEIAEMFDAISCRETVLRVKAEREVLRILDGSCHTPIGAHGVLKRDVLFLKALVVEDGRVFKDEMSGPVQSASDAAALGAALGQRLKAQYR
jgi:hydroxymethylbilane synthase